MKQDEGLADSLQNIGAQIQAGAEQVSKACNAAATASREGVTITQHAITPKPPQSGRTSLQQQLEMEEARRRERESKAAVPVHVELWTWLKDTFTHIVSAEPDERLPTPRLAHMNSGQRA